MIISYNKNKFLSRQKLKKHVNYQSSLLQPHQKIPTMANIATQGVKQVIFGSQIGLDIATFFPNRLLWKMTSDSIWITNIISRLYQAQLMKKLGFTLKLDSKCVFQGRLWPKMRSLYDTIKILAIQTSLGLDVRLKWQIQCQNSSLIGTV